MKISFRGSIRLGFVNGAEAPANPDAEPFTPAVSGLVANLVVRQSLLLARSRPIQAASVLLGRVQRGRARHG